MQVNITRYRATAGTWVELDPAAARDAAAGYLAAQGWADATVNAPNWPTDRRDPTVQESTISTNTCDRGSNPRFAIYTAMQIVRFEADAGDFIERQWGDDAVGALRFVAIDED